MVAHDSIRRAADIARERAGLRVTEHVLDVVGRLIDRRCSELDVSDGEYLDRLSASSPASGELERLIGEITIGETYFFRGQSLDAVRRHLLPELVSRRAREPLPQLRLLSAGCATGEEAYSLAIAVRENVPDPETWTISVTGVDVNTAFLRRAATAVYGEWALRGVPVAERLSWFVREDKGPGRKRFRLRSDVRAMVRFHHFNLAADPLPAPPIGLVGLDLIVCQNVILYFEQEARRAVVRNLAGCLAPEGFVVFGPADRVPPDLPGCRARTFGDVIAYQRSPRAAVAMPVWQPPSVRVPASKRPPATPVPVVETPIPASPRVPKEDDQDSPQASADHPGGVRAEGGRGDSGARAARGAKAGGPRITTIEACDGDAAPASEGTPTFEAAMALADCGDLEAAALAFEAIVARLPGDARAHLHHGFLLVELGALGAAVDAFRRALFLDASLVLGHAAMALVAQRLGMDRLADRHRRRARALARERPDGAPVEGWDGMTAGRLARLFEEEVEVADAAAARRKEP